MFQAPDILTMAYRQPVLQEDLQLILEKDRQIPGSVQYTIRRYSKHPQRDLDDIGMLVYHVRKDEPAHNYLELRFCVAGNVTADVLNFRFQSVHLSQFIRTRRLENTVGEELRTRKHESAASEELLNFRHPSSFSKTLSLCGRTRLVLEALLNHSYTDSLENIFINAQSQMLLLYSLECMVGEKEVEGFQCKFLANEADREKIIRAREILLNQIGEPLTIKALSRKVAINECYLKKGFKEMFGTTIFDFYQGQRMEHARYLLYEKGLSVTEVSVMLGYSSISHFSTAFKKHTGLKPCELLFH
ncbi:MAG TPA: AraC family transcriptional regulator [Puia sp.]|nr:AraC family transcriptional regulator [Puia sp.]